MLAYEDWQVGDDLVGLPSLVSNPSVVFAGLVRGLSYRYRDLGRSEDDGAREALGWVRDFGRSRDGRAYRPWVDRFVTGDLLPAFGGDPRERWWRLIPLQTKLGIAELRARRDPTSDDDGAVRDLRGVLDRLSREIGRPRDDEPGAVRINDLGRDDLVRLLAAAGVTDGADKLADDLLARWPYRGMDHLLAAVPGARALRRLKSRIVFGDVVGDAEQGTLRSLDATSGGGVVAPRALANPEAFGGFVVPAPLVATAVGMLPTFEAYMDAALHHPAWGYYARSVSIGRAGHFNTNPESLSPRYGAWIAARAFQCWLDMIAQTSSPRRMRSRSSSSAPATAGSRATSSTPSPATPPTPAARNPVAHVRGAAPLSHLRNVVVVARQAARVARRRRRRRRRRRASSGDHARARLSRRPARLRRHQRSAGRVRRPQGHDGARRARVRGAGGGARRAGRRRGARPAVSSQRIASDATIRRTFGLGQHQGDLYLDGDTTAAVMAALAGLPVARRDELLDALWFAEAYVPPPPFQSWPRTSPSMPLTTPSPWRPTTPGVMAYVNVHAGRFIRELGASLAAGIIVTIDYGDTTRASSTAHAAAISLPRLRRWQDYVPRPNDPYAAPGTQDMTADVNFTDVANAGGGGWLAVIHFGPERDVAAMRCRRCSTRRKRTIHVAEFLGNPVFKVLVLGKRP